MINDKWTVELTTTQIFEIMVSCKDRIDILSAVFKADNEFVARRLLVLNEIISILTDIGIDEIPQQNEKDA